MRTLTLTIEKTLSEDFLSNILVTAFDADYGGSWYWAGPDRVHSGGIPWEIDGDIWRAVYIYDGEDNDELSSRVRVAQSPAEWPEGVKFFKVDHEALLRGIQELFKPGVLPKRGDIRNAVLAEEAGDIDAEGADVIVQLAVFGCLIYG